MNSETIDAVAALLILAVIVRVILDSHTDNK